MTPQRTVIDVAYLDHQRSWSTETFGPGGRVSGVLDHIRRELVEVEKDPADVGEWADVIILGFDGAWRAGHEPQAILDAIAAKQARNEAREWPDWRTVDTEKAIEHVPGSLWEAISKVLDDAPKGGLDSAEILAEMRERWPDAWPLISPLDVADVCREYLS